MTGWMLPTLLSCFIWGFWGLLPKLASRHLEPWSIFVWSTLGNVTVALGLLIWLGGRPQYDGRGVLYAILGGLAGSFGSIFYNVAAAHGRISVVVTLTGLYPLVTIFLSSLLLQEPMAIKDLVAIGLAISAIALISI